VCSHLRELHIVEQFKLVETSCELAAFGRLKDKAVSTWDDEVLNASATV
jgi:hypothetical protein